MAILSSTCVLRCVLLVDNACWRVVLQKEKKDKQPLSKAAAEMSIRALRERRAALDRQPLPRSLDPPNDTSH